MVCLKCQTRIPDGQLACIPCLKAASRKALLAQQKEYMPTVMKGAMPVRVLHAPGGAHIVLCGGDPLATFCGNIPQGKTYKRAKVEFVGTPHKWIAKGANAPASLCPGCLQEFQKHVKAAGLKAS